MNGYDFENGTLNDRNFLDRAKNFCKNINGKTYDETLHNNESNPMPCGQNQDDYSDTEYTESSGNCSGNGHASPGPGTGIGTGIGTGTGTGTGTGPENISENIYNAAPQDVVVPSDDKINPDLESVTGLDPELGCETCVDYGEKQNNWSAMTTVEEIVNKNGTAVNLNVFQIFVQEIINDKCWNEQDFKDFVNNMKLIKRIMDIKNDEDRMAMMMNPVYSNAIQNLLKGLDTINIICVFGTGDKCDKINNAKQRHIMKQQVHAIGKIVDLYTPIFVQLILLLEKLESQDIDPEHLETITMIKKKLLGSLYMRQQAKRNTRQPIKRLTDNQSKQQNNPLNPVTKNETFTVSTTGSSESDYIFIFLLVVIVVIIVYWIVRSD
jgi:hypothetical protein